jgi:ectoine hydroxylase-related dioxygenase (phytanoyl-CoA dioxygenase family)
VVDFQVSYQLTDNDLAAFQQDGYFVVENLLDAEETELLAKIARADQQLTEQASARADGEGGAIELLVENELGDDIYSAIVRSERVASTMERLLGDEVYHYHHKMILKGPRTGGAWAWHQDYGYWYHNGCLRPTMASCLIAVDKATRENGCLQVVPGSHHLGRIEHGKVGDQTGADPEHVETILERMGRIYVELAAGSAVFFHSNLLHRSDQNKSEHPRWAFICCYNTKGNDPYKESRHPRYSPLEICNNARVLDIGCRQWQSMQSTV